MLAFLAAATSVALVGFGLDSLIEIVASTVVLWELSGTGEARRLRARRLIGVAFIVLAVYLPTRSRVTSSTITRLARLSASFVRSGAAHDDLVGRRSERARRIAGAVTGPCSGSVD